MIAHGVQPTLEPMAAPLGWAFGDGACGRFDVRAALMHTDAACVA